MLLLSTQNLNRCLLLCQESGSEGILIDPELAKQMINSLVEVGEKFTMDGQPLVIVTSPIIRKDIAILLRQHRRFSCTFIYRIARK